MLLPFSVACAQEPTRSSAQLAASNIEIQQEDGPGYRLEVFHNSDTFSQATAINSQGQLIGMREVVDETQTIFAQEYFFIDGSRSVKLPILDGYSNTEIQALSDNGWAAGFASRAVGHADGSLTAIVWDSTSGQLTNLGGLPNDGASQAQDISADGNRITGYSTGADPARIRPCVWTRNPKTQTWDVEALPVIEDNNPFIMSGGVIISPDGQTIAACITVEVLLDGQLFDSSLFVWERKNERWERRQVSDEQMHLKDINNHAAMAAAITEPGARKPCHIDADGNISLIDLLAGDVSGEAHGVNDAGIVVGFSDDPAGPTGGPQAFMWRSGKTEPLALPADAQYSSALAINSKGQIAGLVDVTLAPTADAPADEEPRVATLAFRWTPTK